MATTQAIITRALRRIRVVGVMQDPPAELSTHALDALNALLSSWSAGGLVTDNRVLVCTFASGVKIVTGINATANNVNTDALAIGMHVSGTGIATGTRILSIDDNDQITLDTATTASGTDASLSFTILPLDDSLEQALVAVLAVRLAEDFGVTVGPVLARDAKRGENLIDGAFFRVPKTSFDAALLGTRYRRYYDGVDNS